MEFEIKSSTGQSVMVQCSPKTENSLQSDEELWQSFSPEDVKDVTMLEDDFFVPIMPPPPSNSDEKSKAVWLEKDCKLLIALYKELSPNLGKKIEVKTKRKLWTHIAGRMREHGCIFTPFQVEGKWKTLERGFKNKILHNKKTCAFEQDISDVMLQRAAIIPSYRLGSASDSGKTRAEMLAEAGISTDFPTDFLPEAECMASTSAKQQPEEPKRPKKISTVANELSAWRELRTAEQKQQRSERKERYEEKRRYRENRLQAYKDRTAEMKRRNDILVEHLLKKKS